MFSGSIPNSLQVSISSEYVDSWKSYNNYKKKSCSRKFIPRCCQQINRLWTRELGEGRLPEIITLLLNIITLLLHLGCSDLTRGGRCQAAKFYDVNSVNKKSWRRNSCKFATFSRKPAIPMGEKRKPLWCYKTLIRKFDVILLFGCCKSWKIKLQLQNDLLSWLLIQNQF